MTDFLTPTTDRFVLFPIRFQSIYEAYKAHMAVMWRVEEIDLSQDREDWGKLTCDERRFLLLTLSFFAGADGLVGETIVTSLYNAVQVPECRLFYGYQLMTEGVHVETYAMLLNEFASPEEKRELFHGMDEIPVIRAKADWAARNTRQDVPFGRTLLCFAAVEGVFFCSSFACIYWFKKRSLMPGLTFSNELISRDESLHVAFSCQMYKALPADDRMSQSDAHALLKEAAELECEFVRMALQSRLIGMNAPMMCTYVHYMTDRIAQQLGYEPIYRVSNPLDYMVLISLQGSQKTNFFESRVSSYELACTAGRETAFDEL